MLNLHSVSFKFPVIILIVSLTFLSAMSVFTTQLVIEQYTNMENEKVRALSTSILPTLSLNVSFGFDEATQETVHDLYAQDNILYVRVIDHNRTIIQAGTQSYRSLIDAGHFGVFNTLYDPVTAETIGSFEIVYSNQEFLQMLDEYYERLAVLVVLFLAAILFIAWMLYHTTAPLRRLASAMMYFNPQNPKAIPQINSSPHNEIGRIAYSYNVMIEATINHINELENLKTTLMQREAHLNHAQRLAHVGSWEYRLPNNTFEISPEMLRILGINAKNRHLNWKQFLHYIIDEDRQYVQSVLNNALKNGTTFNIKYRCHKMNGDTIHIQTQGKVRKKSTGIINITGVSMDITQQYRDQQLIEKLAYYDPLTGLPNRTLFKNRLDKAITSSKRRKSLVTVMFIDLDRFKLINDSLGHIVGDDLLQHVAHIFEQTLRKEDTVSRLGGDEFTILIPSSTNIAEAENIAQKLLQSISGRLQIGKHELYISLSLGIACYPLHGQNSDELIKNADTAMYHAKERGRNNYQVYKTQLGNYLDKQRSLEQDFKEAVTSKSGLCLHYQPKIDLNTLKVVGAEALIRWKHPKLGMLFPDQFIALAESTGLIIDLGNWILEEAMRQASIWQHKHPISIAINLSARQLQDDALFKLITHFLTEFQLDASLIEFEITESLSMSNISNNLLFMEGLKSLGTSIAIDDFGTGYSSMAYLKQFPIDTIKIDKSFVIDMLNDPDDATITSTIISMAHSLGFKTVAEGVETLQHQQQLQAMGCDIAQGYYYSKAVDTFEFEHLFSHHQ